MAFECPLLTQHFFQQPLVRVRWDAIDFVVGRHHAHHAGFGHGGFEARQEKLTQGALGIIRWSDVRSAFRLTVRGEVFRRGDNVIAVDHWPGPLQRFDDRDRHARSEIRIFAIGFFSATPTRLACNVQIRAKHLMAATSACFLGGGGEHSVDEFRIPRCRERNRLRKTRAALSHVAVKNFVVKDRGDAEPRVFNQPLLRGVGEDCAVARAFLFPLSRDLADAVFHYLSGFFGREVSAIG